MGYTGSGGRGFFLHTTLAEGALLDLNQRPEGVVLGLLSQQCWNRSVLGNKGQETRRQSQDRQRESDRWARVLMEGPPRDHSRSSWVLIADREADFYEPIQRAQNTGSDFVIRAFHDWCLSGTVRTLPARAEPRLRWWARWRWVAGPSGDGGPGRG
jgi:hypothetical protein